MKKVISAAVATSIVVLGMGAAWAAISRTAAVTPTKITTVPATVQRLPATGS